MGKVITDLPNWQSLGHSDLRYLSIEHFRSPMPEVDASDTHEGAISILEKHLGFLEPEIKIITKPTPLWTLNIIRDSLPHIVEKRRDARERYVNMALDTLANPYEIWEAMYDDGLARYQFIGTYQQKYQMLVVVAPWDGKVLRNYMQTERKSLNKHRCGDLLFKRI